MHAGGIEQVAIVCGAGIVSGKEVIALELVDGLRTHGDRVEVVTSRWGNGDFTQRLQTRNIPVHSMWLGFISATLTLEHIRMTLHQGLHWPELILSYRRFLSRSKPKCIVHTNWHHLLILSPFLNAERDCFWLHECIPNKHSYCRIFGWLAQRLHCFIPVSHAVADSLRQIGIPDEKIHIIHNGISDPVPAGSAKVHQWNGIRVGIVGQVGAWKGHEDLWEAFARIAKQHSAAELHVFGTDTSEFANRLKQQAEKLGIASRLVWHGFVVGRANIYGQMDVCVVPSRAPDPLPTTAIEAAFFGIPVVASNCGGLPEIVEDGATGFLVEPERPLQLAGRLDELLRNLELRRKMGALARRRAELLFSRERFIADFRRILPA
jgi:glycosyltransferase involved in cell wall biosynthesis